MPSLTTFLATVPVLGGLDEADLAELAGACEVRTYTDRALVLQQGDASATLYFLKRGTVAVRVSRSGRRETVAELLPPAIFGELSFLTGRTCSADVEALGEIDVVTLSADRLASLGRSREALLQLLLTLVAGRLHDTVTGQSTLHRPRVVWVRADSAFGAAQAFASELAEGLRERSVGDTLLVADRPGLGPEPAPSPARGLFLAAPPPEGRVAERLGSWKDSFRYVVVLDRQDGRPPGPLPPIADAVADLVAGGEALPAVAVPVQVVGADAERARLDVLSGSRQLLFDVDEASRAFADGRDLPPRFRHTARSLARAVAGRQVGVALGGGGACCWAHIGLLDTLARAGIPVDVLAGCSMGSFIGSLVASGRSQDDLLVIAEHWRRAYRWMVEWRAWRMHLINERRLRKVMHGYFADRALNQLERPFWANAVDVITGEEVILNEGKVSDTVRASMALPGSSSPLPMGDRILIDAAVFAPVPVGPVRAMGAAFVIAMNVMPSMRAGAIPRRNPLRFFDVLFRALRISGHEIGRNRAVGDADILLTPALEEHSLLDFPRSPEIIAAGRETAERHRAQIVAGYQRIVDARQ